MFDLAVMSAVSARAGSASLATTLAERTERSLFAAISRKLIFAGLTARISYTLQLCAIGGSTGKSDWRDPVSKMSM